MPAVDPDKHCISLLHVEDDADSQETIIKIIRHRYPDICIHIADNGKTGLELFKRYRPEIVITDIYMPKLSGLTMAKDIKAMSPSTEIIAVSAYSNTEYLLQAIEIGISNYVIKPVDMEKLFRIIDKTIASIRSSQLIAWQNEMIRDLNTKLEQNAADLVLANQELESYDYTIAHDLRTPIAVINNFLEILLKFHVPALNAEGNRLFQLMRCEFIRMSSLVDVLLKFSVSSRKHVKKEWTNLSEIANDVRDKLPESYQASFSVAEKINGYCDPNLMRIVLENLFGNAVKYSSGISAPRIEFGTINKDENLVYYVRDNGKGFDQRESEKLFRPFQRIQPEEQAEGCGIGLATVHRIISRHGGSVWAEGEQGKGATFYFTL